LEQAVKKFKRCSGIDARQRGWSLHSKAKVENWNQCRYQALVEVSFTFIWRAPEEEKFERIVYDRWSE
jgi:hypothetical protein